ncbi:MAG TPA: hypothetical protein VHJ38_13165 [Nitrososphaeraceae archaeon]|nr:hypothetical protein [Nitrososphaeraceae archaeon]HSF00643.1 hypothetical protein [Nitrososphaeraceae archaeon]
MVSLCNKYLKNRIYPPPVTASYKQHSQELVSPQYGHTHIHISIEFPQ